MALLSSVAGAEEFVDDFLERYLLDRDIGHRRRAQYLLTGADDLIGRDLESDISAIVWNDSAGSDPVRRPRINGLEADDLHADAF